MRRWIGAVSAVATGLLVSLVAAGTASAHPIDELLQQVYVTPTATGAEIDLELTAGVSVADQVLGVVDTDGNGTIDDAEAAAYTDLLLSHLTVTVGGDAVTPTLVSATYPAAELVGEGGGTIALELTVAATGHEREVAVSDTYVPVAVDGSPITSTLQINLTPAVDHPVTVGSLVRSDDGRTLAVAYTEAGTSGSGSSSTSGLAAMGACGLLAAAGLVFRRRRTAQPPVAVEVSA